MRASEASPCGSLPGVCRVPLLPSACLALRRIGDCPAAQREGWHLAFRPAFPPPQSVFAHGNLLTDAELERMAARGAALAHCPLSNFYYAEKLLPVARLLDMGIKARRGGQGNERSGNRARGGLSGRAGCSGDPGSGGTPCLQAAGARQQLLAGCWMAQGAAFCAYASLTRRVCRLAWAQTSAAATTRQCWGRSARRWWPPGRCTPRRWQPRESRLSWRFGTSASLGGTPTC